MAEGTRAKKAARKAAAKKAAGEAGLEDVPFEEALARLEGLVDRLEEGDLDLADALAHFEEGVALTRHCTGQLEAAERRIELLTRESGDWATRPFAGGAEDDDDFDEEGDG